MSNPRPKEDPDPFQARQSFHITARVFSSSNNEVGRLNYVRHGWSEVGTLVAHILYANSAFYAVEVFISNRPLRDKPPSGKRTDELPPDEDGGAHTRGRLPTVP